MTEQLKSIVVVVILVGSMAVFVESFLPEHGIYDGRRQEIMVQIEAIERNYDKHMAVLQASIAAEQTTTTSTTTTLPPSTTTTVAPAPPATLQAAAVTPAAPSAGVRRTLKSTNYCLSGTMASGQGVHDGAVAFNSSEWRQYAGTQWKVVASEDPQQRFVGRTFTVLDHGPGAHFDIWVNSCEAARNYGTYNVTVEQVG